MSEVIDVVLPTLHPGQREALRVASRFNVLACGRRWGKTVLGLDRLIDGAIDGRPVAWFAPSYKLLLEPWRECLRILRDATTRANATERRVELITGGVIEFWSLDDPDAARGRKYAVAVIDEAAMIRHLGQAWQAAIRPTLADHEGSAWMLSTPKGRNFFWRCYQWGVDPARPDWMAHTMPTGTNPHIPPAEVDRMRHAMPERIYKQEVEAEFIEDAGGVFRGVREAATARPQERAVAGHEYVMGVDWARHEDFTVLVVVDCTTGEMVKMDRFTQIDYAVQTSRLKDLADRFGPTTILAELNSMGGPLVEQLEADGLPVRGFQTTNQSKNEIIRGLEKAFNRSEIRILPDETLIGELQAYEQERLAAGSFRFSAPEGMHDDTVMSLALAWHAATLPTYDYSRI